MTALLCRSGEDEESHGQQVIHEYETGGLTDLALLKRVLNYRTNCGM